MPKKKIEIEYSKILAEVVLGKNLDKHFDTVFVGIKALTESIIKKLRNYKRCNTENDLLGQFYELQKLIIKKLTAI